MPQFNRIITIEKPVIIRDNFGSEVTTWATHSQVWAEKRETKSDEKFAAWLPPFQWRQGRRPGERGSIPN